MNKIFYARELGWRRSTEQRGNIKYKIPYFFKQLSPQDQGTANYVIKHVHGLPFHDHPSEQAKPQAYLQTDISQLYEHFRNEEQDVVGFKGGHVEKGMLDYLDIPHLNLERWGCPKFELLSDQGFADIQDCGCHRVGHCSTVECEAFWNWLEHKKKSMGCQQTWTSIHIQPHSGLNEKKQSLK